MGRLGRSYSRWMIGLALVSAILAVLVSWLDRSHLIPDGVRPVVVLLPIVPLIAFFFRIVRWLKELDELERMIHHEAMLVQFAATGILIMSYGMLARAGLVPDLRATQVFPFLWLALFLFWSAGLVLVRRKYQ